VTSVTTNDRPWRLASLLLLAVLLVLAGLTFRDYGISNDEEVQHVYGEMLWDFYASGFSDTAAFRFRDLYRYGGLFDMIAVGLAPHLPFETYETRHLLSGFIGILGIAGVWRLASHLGGGRAGFIAALLLATSGAWYGAMFNHTKDVPFAAAMVWAVYFLCRVLEGLPRPNPWLVAGFGLAAGCSLGIRVGGVLLGVYAGIGVLAWCVLRFRDHGWVAVLGDAARIAIRLLPGAVIAYGLMAVFWPWAVLDLLNPLRALAGFSQYRPIIDTVVDGDVVRVYDLPASYLPVYLAIKLPLVFLLGVAAAAVITVVPGFRGRPRRRLAETSIEPRHLGLGLTALAAAFPVLYFVLTVPTAYDGIRHFLFVVPPLAVIAGIGLDRLLSLIAIRGLVPARMTAALLTLVIAFEVHSLVRLHPHQYVGYNQLIGGLKGARNDYVLDYWANTVPEATQALTDYLRREHRNRPITRVYTVLVCSERLTFEAVAPPFLRWVRDIRHADFFIGPTHMGCDKILDGRTVHEVRRMDVVLAVVKDRRTLTASKPPPPRG
jgi:hypothetical protein